jgi:hypothetical protein
VATESAGWGAKRSDESEKSERVLAHALRKFDETYKRHDVERMRQGDHTVKIVAKEPGIPASLRPLKA